MNGLLNKALRKVFSICWRCGSRFYIFLRRLVKTLPAPQQGSTAGKKAVYLTFDDGPLPQTAALLDTLKRYGAHATFFVSGGSAPDLIGRMAREGHCVGNHTFSHKYREIYAGEDAFFKDAAEMDAVICSQTGAPSRFLRFPGGSGNTVSRFNPGIMTRLTDELKARGIVWADWNVDSGDKAPITAPAIYRNVCRGILREECPVVLQHMDVPNSMATVERILIWGQKNGCVFLPMTEEMPIPREELRN